RDFFIVDSPFRNHNWKILLLNPVIFWGDYPVTLQLIRELHDLLMTNVRGGDQTPGAFRTTQNWIGKKDTPIEQARFIPPTPLIMKDALDNLQNYIALDDTDPLVQLAIIHAQFEIIHPFKDGNGRLGRMLIPLLLYQKEVLQRPMFYLSEYLEESDQEYRDRLLAITDAGDWQGWIEFFLTAIHKQALRNTEKAEQIHILYEDMKTAFVGITHSQYAVTALDAFFTRPIMNSSDFFTLSRMENRGTANTMLRNLVNEGILTIMREGSGRRSAIYAFPALINISEGHRVL
ncbi:MAG: Fic family protein, partial [Candidatus Thiodiazotropha sp. (ex Ustalcina ferruginea)]|nr:Fic family protein [Candidatus Thiodiazotropha sp. (ex Ustalcina ferruginea)]